MFLNIIELLMEAEKLFDQLRYPQASTRTRYFQEPEVKALEPRPDKVMIRTFCILPSPEKGHNNPIV